MSEVRNIQTSDLLYYKNYRPFYAAGGSSKQAGRLVTIKRWLLSGRIFEKPTWPVISKRSGYSRLGMIPPRYK